MSIKEKTLNEIENRIESIEDAISENGIGSGYLKKIEKIQRDVNLGLLAAGAATVFGLTAYGIFKATES